ncbi:MAG: hypothetical protein K2Y29_21515, partial [Beijerinckiaceae bacterium]|nr:hypothetical protein [Beijerinckiaceae bacterium]
MMLYRRDLAPFGELVVEVPAPSCWVVANSMSANLRPAENGLDMPTQPRGGFGSRRPNRFKHFQYKRSVDLTDRQVGKNRMSIGLERRSPLIGAFGVLPSRRMRSDESGGTEPGGNVPSRGRFQLSYLRALFLYRVKAIARLRLFAVRLREAHLERASIDRSR